MALADSDSPRLDGAPRLHFTLDELQPGEPTTAATV